MSLARLLPVVVLATLPHTACEGSRTGADPEPDPITIPAVGEASTLDVGAWNIEWFGSPTLGPADDTLQLSRVAAAVDGLEIDLWGLSEIVDAGQWNLLLGRLPAYDGLLASDPRVEGGAAAYHSREQKTALLWHREVVEVRSARVVLAEEEIAFAGRPPLEAAVRVALDGDTAELVVLVVHMKAGSGADDRAHRERASLALHAYLTATHPDAMVLVLGDFNDDVDRSIHAGAASPYANFVNDTTGWTFLTAPLSAAGQSSTARYPDMVDHHLGSDEWRPFYLEGSASVIRLDAWIPAYDRTTSDHFPVTTRYHWSGDH